MTKRRQTIPNDVLDKIRRHRPHMGAMIDNLKAHPNCAAQIERAIADAYLLGETRLSGLETWRLSACSVGRPYGES